MANGAGNGSYPPRRGKSFEGVWPKATLVRRARSRVKIANRDGAKRLLHRFAPSRILPTAISFPTARRFAPSPGRSFRAARRPKAPRHSGPWSHQTADFPPLPSLDLHSRPLPRPDSARWETCFREEALGSGRRFGPNSGRCPTRFPAAGHFPLLTDPNFGPHSAVRMPFHCPAFGQWPDRWRSRLAGMRQNCRSVARKQRAPPALELQWRLKRERLSWDLLVSGSRTAALPPAWAAASP